MNAASHDLKTCCFLTADEYLFARDEAEARGLSVSAFIRTLVIKERRAVSISKLSPFERYEHSAETGPFRCMDTYKKVGDL